MKILDTLNLRLICGLLIGLALAFPSFAAEDAPAADTTVEDAESAEGEGEGEDEEKEDYILVIEPAKKIDREEAGVQILKYLELGRSLWEGGDTVMAEKYFAAALGVPIDADEKEQVLYEMGTLYKEAALYPKAAAVYERLVQEFGQSRQLASIYMELGHIYRKMGGLKVAINNYYMVINSTLNISVDQVEKARRLSLEAKLEIAETHAELLEYEESYRHYELLAKLDLKPVERMRVDYRMCNLLYELGRYQTAVSKLKLFLDNYALSAHSPEIRYLLARSYEKLNRKPDALREVVQILQRQSSPDTALEGASDYWKQRTGNELANEFYQKADYRSALTIYQSLAKYNASPEWRWPAIHQIGLCFERLGLPEKAILAYQEIVDPEDGPTEEPLTPGLETLREMAKWRLEHLNWEDDLIARLNVLGAQ